MKWIFGFKKFNKEIGVEYEISDAPIDDVNGRYSLYSNDGGINSNLPIYINENKTYVMGPVPAASDEFAIAPVIGGVDYWPSAVYMIYVDEDYFRDVTEEIDYSMFSGKFSNAPDLKIIKCE